MAFWSWTCDLPTVSRISTKRILEQSELPPGNKRRKREEYPVLFLTSNVTNAQRSKILTQLCDPEPADSWPERPKGVHVRSVKVAIWIRNWTPGKGNAPSLEACIARMVRTSLMVNSINSAAGEVRIVPGGEAFGKRLGRGMILIDEEALKGLNTEKSARVIVATWAWELKDEAKDPEHDGIDPSEAEVQMFAARVPIHRANLLLSFAYNSTTHQAFEEIVPDLIKLEFSEAGNATLSQSGDEMDDDNALPSHLSKITAPNESKVEIVSLVHLTNEEKKGVIVKIRRTSSELKSDKSASSESGERQAKSTKEETATNEEEKKSNNSAHTLPVEIYNWPADGESCSRANLYRIFQHIQRTTPPEQKAKCALFVDVRGPSPDSRSEPELLLVKQSYYPGTRIKFDHSNSVELLKWQEDESVVEQWPFLCDPTSEKRKPKPGKSFWWDTFINGFELVPNPDKKVWPDGTMQCFVLINLSETELRRLKSRILEEHDHHEWGSLQFIEVGAYLSSPDIQGLMQWFEECMIDGVQPPHQFLAVDQQSFDYYVTHEGDKDEAMILASSESMHNYHNDAELTDVIGLGFGRLSTDDAVAGCVNLSVSNMTFVGEILEEDMITYLYWSDILEAERLDPGSQMFLSDHEYTEGDQVFTAQPQDETE